MSRILLVEDDTMIASGILYALETEGYETNHATRIKDARSLIEHYNFDLAIIDMQLPDGTGFDVSEIFKNNATPVIFLTVVDDENTRRLRNTTDRINTAFFVTYKQITPHRIWYNRVD